MTLRAGPSQTNIRRSWAATVLVVVTAQVWPVSAQQPAAPAPATPVAEPPRLALAIACGARDAAVRAVVAVEVGDLLLDAAVPAARSNDRLAIVCTGAAAQLDVQAAGAPTPLRRTLDLGTFPPDAVARALALAGLETLAEVSPSVQRRLQSRVSSPGRPHAQGPTAERVSPSPPPAEARAVAPGALPAPAVPALVVPPPPEAPVSPSVIAVASPVEVVLAGTWRGFGADHGPWLWGARGTVARGFGSRWNAELDLDAGFGRVAAPFGTVATRAFSVGAFWGWRGETPGSTRVVGVGGRVGVVNLSGRPDDPAAVAGDSVVHPWAGPAVLGRLMTGRDRWAFAVSAEVGLTVRGATGVAGTDTAVEVRGPWLLLGVGVGMRLKR